MVCIAFWVCLELSICRRSLQNEMLLDRLVATGEPSAGRPSSSGSTQCRRPFEEVQENHAIDSPLSSSQSFARSRSVRRRVDFDHLSIDQQPFMELPPIPIPRRSQTSTELATTPARVHMPHTFEFVVYLPNRSSIEVQVPAEVCRNLTVQGFVKFVKTELGRSGDTKVKQRGIIWGKRVVVRDFQGRPVQDGEFASSYESKAGKVLLLYDLHPDTVHAHPGFWNVTPEPHMLEVLPQDYTLFSALADELDFNRLSSPYSPRYNVALQQVCASSLLETEYNKWLCMDCHLYRSVCCTFSPCESST